MRKTLFAFALSATALVATPAMADNNVTVTSLQTPPVPPTNQWGVLPGENSPGATAELSTTNVSDTDGSLHIAGDRVRVQTGVQYTNYPGVPGSPTSTGIAANELVSLTADYFTNALGTNLSATPTFRVLIQDGTQRSELIWEGSVQPDNQIGLGFGQVEATDLFWQYIAGCGATLVGGGCTNSGTYVKHTLEEWGNLYSSNAFVSGLSIGVGSGAGAGFDANVDNLVLKTSNPNNTNRYNFAAAVPEPATWAMMLLGFGGIGASMRRQRRSVKLAQLA